MKPPRSLMLREYHEFRDFLLGALDDAGAHEADVGTMLCETLAFAADRAAYAQEAVYAEGFLSTSRQRRSVQRHLRLSGLRMHDGCNGRGFVIACPSESMDVRPMSFHDRDAAGGIPLRPIAEVAPKLVVPARNRAEVLSLSDEGCVLRFQADPGDLTGAFVALGGSHVEHVARVTVARRSGDQTLDLVWADEDSNGRRAVGRLQSTHAWCNVIPVEVAEACRSEVVVERDTWILPIAFADIVRRHPPASDVSARSLLAADPRLAHPVIRLSEAQSGHSWEWRQDLLASRPHDRHFALEPYGPYTVVRFGDGNHGARPAPRARFEAELWVGNGSRHGYRVGTTMRIVTPEAPSASSSQAWLARQHRGSEPETAPDEATAYLPECEVLRTCDDYRDFVRRRSNVDVRVDAQWRGDRRHVSILAPQQTLSRVRALSHEIQGRALVHDEIVFGDVRTVEIDVVLRVGVPSSEADAVVAAVARRLCSPGGVLASESSSGMRGIAASSIIAEAQRVAGVRWVWVARLARATDDERAPSSPFLELAFDERPVARLSIDVRSVDDEEDVP